MRMALAQWFGDGYHKLNQQQDARFGLNKIPTQDAQGNGLPEVRCLQAHFHHGHGSGLPYFYPEVDQYITMLRDPFDLMVSMYFFTKGRSKAGQFWYRGRPVDINDQYPTIESYVQSYPYWLYSHLPQNLTLANYRTKLAQQFVYIGIFEDLQTSIDRLAERLGQRSVTVPVSNTSQYDEMVPQHLRAQFYFDFPLPKKIYDFACENYRNDSLVSIESENSSATLPGALKGLGDPGNLDESTASVKTDALTDDAVVCGDMSPLEPS